MNTRYMKGWKETKLQRALRLEFKEERKQSVLEIVFITALVTALFLKVIHFLAA